MANSIAELKGTILYIDGAWRAGDVTPDEAAELIAELQGLHNAPTGVRIPTKLRRQQHKRN